jgi:hypothetical protein
MSQRFNEGTVTSQNFPRFLGADPLPAGTVPTREEMDSGQ